MATTPNRRPFRITREVAFWVLAAVALIVIGIVLDVFWGNL
jgi:hypothetical protein